MLYAMAIAKLAAMLAVGIVTVYAKDIINYIAIVMVDNGVWF